jgi:hypothetical protein
MPVVNIGGQLQFVRLSLEPGEILGLLEQHTQCYPGDEIPALEEQAVNLIGDDFPPDDSCAFAQAVIQWGRGHRNLARFLNNNNELDIANALENAHQCLTQQAPAAAIAQLVILHHLGQSFASKLLRFLSPTQAVILDSVIRTGLGYRDDADGYNAFLQDCQCVKALTVNIPELHHLRLCDIEAAIYVKVRDR